MAIIVPRRQDITQAMGLRVNNTPQAGSVSVANTSVQTPIYVGGQPQQYAPPPPPPVHPSFFSQLGHLAGGLVSPAVNLYRADISGPIREEAASFTHNPVAYNRAVQAHNQALADVGHNVQAITRTVPEVIGTLSHPLDTNYAYKPTGVGKVLFGDTPVQNIQAKVVGNYKAHPNLPGYQRVGLAAAELGGSIFQDLPVVGAAAKIARVAERRGVAAGLSTQDVSRMESEDSLHGLTPDEHAQIEAASNYKNSDAFVKDLTNQYYQLDKSLRGGDKIPDGQGGYIRTSEHTPFYRDYYAENGKAPTKAAYEQAIRDELKSGRPTVAQQGEHGIFQLIKDREADLASLDELAPARKSGFASPTDMQPRPPLISDADRAEMKLGEMHQAAQAPKQPARYPVKNDYFNPSEVTDTDRVMGNQAGTSGEIVANARDIAKRNAGAEAAAIAILRNGGSRLEAATEYMAQTGATARDAMFRVQRAVKESNLAPRPRDEFGRPLPKVTLNANPVGKNPREGLHDLPTPKPGDHVQADMNARAVRSQIVRAANHALSYERDMSAADKANFVDYVQGVKNVANAENPSYVRAAIDAWRNLADTAHALDSNFNATKYIEDYFPQYWKDIAEQGPEAQMRAEEAAIAGKPIPMEDKGMYAGFRNKERIFASQAEGKQAGFEPMNENPFDDIRRYATGAQLTIGDEALMRGARAADLTSDLKGGQTVDLPSGKSFKVSPEGYKVLKGYGIKNVNVITKAFRGVNKTIVKTIVANPIFHGTNQEFNLLFQAAWRMPGFGPANMIRLLVRQARLTEEERANFFNTGGFSPDYGRYSYGFIGKGMEKTGINPRLSQLPNTAMANWEENIRVALFKESKLKGMTSREAHDLINKTLGGPDIINDMASAFGLFYHYLRMNTKLLGDIGVEASKGNIGPLVGLAAGYAAWTVANKGWQAATGNPDASIRPPGVLGTARQYAKAPAQLRRGQVPGIITSHTNPVIRTAVEMAANRDVSKPTYGPSSMDNTIRGPKGIGIKNELFKNLLGPGQSILRTQSGQQGTAEGLVGAVAGIYTPHAKGYQAAPNIPALNDPNAKPGTGIADRDKYFKAQGDAFKVLGNDSKNIDAFRTYFDRTRDPSDPTTVIGRDPRETLARYSQLYANENLRNAVQTMEKQLPNHDPMWDLSPKDLKTFIQYEKQYAADPERARIVEQQTDFNGGKGITDFVKQRQNFYDSKTTDYKFRPSDWDIAHPYPKLDNNTQNAMTTYDSLADNQKTDYLSAHPEIIQAFKTISDYNNEKRIQQGALPLQQFPEESDHVKAVFNAMPQGTDKGSARTRAILIDNNPDVQAYLSEAALQTVTKNLAGYYLQIKPGQTEAQELNAGSDKAQKTLKDIQSLGKYDVSKDANGLYSIAGLMGNNVIQGGVNSGSGVFNAGGQSFNVKGGKTSSGSSVRASYFTPSGYHGSSKFGPRASARSLRRPRLTQASSRIRVHKPSKAITRFKGGNTLRPVKAKRTL